MGSNSFWFKHDYDERGKGVLEDMVRDHGAMGYGAYNIFKEIMHQSDDSRLEFTEKRKKRLARGMSVTEDWLNGWVTDCIELYEIYRLENGFLVSQEVLNSKAEREDRRTKKAENGRKGGKASAKKRKANGTEDEAIGINDASKNTNSGINSEQLASENENNTAIGIGN